MTDRAASSSGLATQVTVFCVTVTSCPASVEHPVPGLSDPMVRVTPMALEGDLADHLDLSGTMSRYGIVVIPNEGVLPDKL